MSERAISLLDYANARDHVVLRWTSIGCPGGEEQPIGLENDWADQRGILDLVGAEKPDGRWQWNGEGGPTDHAGNSILNLIAFQDWDGWERLVASDSEPEGEPTYQCGCGAWTGERCEWSGPASEMVVVEWMPVYLRDSHRAAGNSGSYPHNGALRVAVERSCADLLLDNEADAEWADARPGLDVTRYAEEG